jgi:hypothetical protein
MAVDRAVLAQTQATSASASASKTASQPAAKKAGGAPPAGGGGGAKPAAATGSTSSSSSTAKVYDEKDTNQDGVVSAMEALLYSITHAADEDEDTSAVSTSQVQTGLKAYQQDRQTSNSAVSALLSSI